MPATSISSTTHLNNTNQDNKHEGYTEMKLQKQVYFNLPAINYQLHFHLATQICHPSHPNIWFQQNNAEPNTNFDFIN